jgi:hypothetical protein
LVQPPVPPQSIAVSTPFLMPSEQVAATHLPAAQSRLAQSVATLHLPLVTQGEQEPPQSTSLSVPFVTPSAHVGA